VISVYILFYADIKFSESMHLFVMWHLSAKSTFYVVTSCHVLACNHKWMCDCSKNCLLCCYVSSK